MATVGIIGLAIMGSAYAGNLLKGGVAVEGADPTMAAREALEQAEGVSHEAAGDWLTSCDLVILSVASPKVLAEVSASLGGILQPGQIVMETGTFAMADKLAAKEAVERSGAVLLDCPVSGTGAQAAKGDLLIMASGPSDAIARARPFMEHLCHTVMEAGEFGAGSKLKYVANHIVALHNCAAAEALHYGDAMGLDRQVTYDLLSKGAGQSRMLDLRMPLMIAGAYEPATATMSMFQKDLSIIGVDIRAHNISTPMFDAANDVYGQGWSSVPMSYDTAAVFEVYRQMDEES